MLGMQQHRPSPTTSAHVAADLDLPGNSEKSAKRPFKSRVRLAATVNTAMEAREHPDTVLIPFAEVLRMTSLSRSSVYKLIRLGDMPRQVPLGPHRVAWIKSEVENWIATRAALRSTATEAPQ